MATFTNQATLSYNGVATNSNIVVGEIQEVLAITKTALVNSYFTNDTITYVVSVVNSGTTAFTTLTLTDDLGEYTQDERTLVPLTYIADSLKYYINGVLQPTPTVSAGAPLTVSGISVPAGGNALIIYEVKVNQYAPLAASGSITNEAELSGGGLTAAIGDTETVTAGESVELTIAKALSPSRVPENGQVTYTFTITNTGNTAVPFGSDIVLSDIFDPVLTITSVTFDGVAWSEPANYTYNEATGEFATVSGQITVPAASYTQDENGAWIVEPGVSTLVVVGTI
ncbi:MAG: hypothetical protein E7487_06790 [Ruminococcaceae bacterium]|nr:hypothetical protein [Oscillospiraceae bacterium]